MPTTPNPALKKLGLAPDDRAVIIHTDDVGMCQASVAAFAQLWEAGTISSGATMVPCPWFPHLAAYCQAHPNVDMGVHTTLTSEWDAYRWGPISSRDPATGMLDAEGYFPRATGPVQENGDPLAVERELQAQVERAIAAGIVPTHIDTHMGAVMHPKFMSGYLNLALKYRVPVLAMRLSAEQWRQQGLDAEAAVAGRRALEELEAGGVPLLDAVMGMPLDVKEDHVQFARRAFAALPAGITHFLLHPAQDTPELRTLAPDWRGRAANLEAFLREDLHAYLKQTGIHVIGYRALKELMSDL